MQKIVLDTSVLMLPAERRLDVIAECERLSENCEFFVLKPTVAELKAMATKRNKAGFASRIALQVIEKNKIATIASKVSKADDAMIAMAREDRTTVFATTDAGLRRKLRALDAKVICLKGEAHLDWC